MESVRGDAEATADDPATPPLPSSAALCSRPSVSGGGFGGRFWVLASAVDDEEALSIPSEEGSPTGSPRREVGTPFGVFLRAAEELGGSLRSVRREAFAPGGRGSRFAAGGCGGGSGERSRWRRPLPRTHQRASDVGLGGGWGLLAAHATTRSDLVAHGATPSQETSSPEAAAAPRRVPLLASEIGFPQLRSRPVEGPFLGPAHSGSTAAAQGPLVVHADLAAFSRLESPGPGVEASG